MCQILRIKDIEKENIMINKEFIIENLDTKGGDDYSVSIINKEIITIKNKNIDEIFNFIEKIDTIYFSEIIFFSRQKPEMEENDYCAPYSNKDKSIWMHGTIYNDTELSYKYNMNISNDSEVFLFANLPEIKGLYTVLIYDKENNKLKWIQNGMGLWKFYINDLYIESVTPTLIYKNQEIKGVEIETYEDKEKEKNIYVSFSGGMDISLSVYKVLKDIEKNKNIENVNLKLIYFKYNKLVESDELKSIYNYIDFLKNQNSKNQFIYNLNIDYGIFDLTSCFKDFSKVFDTKFLNESVDNIEAEENEAEENITYVPFRNSIFVNYIKTIMDNSKKYGDIVLGLNLSEGQVFGDNNSYWLEGAERVAKSGGKQFTNLKIISPYINRTKTNMLKEFIKEFGEEIFNEIINISFSCYYPKNGKPCMECGSCILRQKSIEKVLGDPNV